MRWVMVAAWVGGSMLACDGSAFGPAADDDDGSGHPFDPHLGGIDITHANPDPDPDLDPDPDPDSTDYDCSPAGPIWARGTGGSDAQMFHDVAIDPAHDIWLVGETTTSTAPTFYLGGKAAGVIEKRTADGTTVWRQTLQSIESNGSVVVHEAVVDGNGDAWVGGYFVGTVPWGSQQLASPNGGASFIARLDAQGAPKDIKYLDGYIIEDLALDPSQTTPTLIGVITLSNLPPPASDIAATHCVSTEPLRLGATAARAASATASSPRPRPRSSRCPASTTPCRSPPAPSMDARVSRPGPRSAGATISTASTAMARGTAPSSPCRARSEYDAGGCSS